jgi:hypothetical protein
MESDGQVAYQEKDIAKELLRFEKLFGNGYWPI